VDFLSEMAAFLDAHPEVGLAYANAIWHRNLTGKKEEANCNLAVDFGPQLMRIRNPIRTPTVMHRREVVAKVGYFKPIKVRVPHADASYVGIEDWDYWLRVSERFEVRQHPVILAHKINETSDHYLDPDFDPEFEAAPEAVPETEGRDLFYRMGIAADFKALESALAGVEGHLNPAEGYALMQLAAHGAGTGEIVEIGSFMGLSTCWLALGAKSGGREPVTAVDHFKGSKEHQAGRRHECAVLVEQGSTYPRFLENIERAGVKDQVRPVVATSEEAAKSWDRPIRLLFIDGDHRYESTRRDFELWSRFVVEGGYIAFHDVDTWPGVTRFYHELVEQGGFQEVFAALALRIVRKTGGKT
jgi:predicted O-methyltransferase YrrM